MPRQKSILQKKKTKRILSWKLRSVRTEAYEETGKDIGSTGRRQGLS